MVWVKGGVAKAVYLENTGKCQRVLIACENLVLREGI
jgi:hypothetical protein